ncbi:MAG TPA: sodium:proton antiporter, partial [Thermoanaerobaculia bacterium]|nr:sodium:proton antiporter [Thermoanaerobaculia bacterium]
VALTCLALLLLFDLVTPAEAIAGFSNEAVITVMMMFILAESLVQSGLISKLGYQITHRSGSSRWTASVLLLLVTAFLSAFVNNTAAVSVSIPVALHLSREYRFSPSKLLMPLSFAAIFGGTCTLIGTSTNLLVSSLASEHGLHSFSMFEFLELGSILLLIGLAYTIVVPMRLLPSRSPIASLTRKYHLSGYLTELRVPGSSKLIGRTVIEEQLSGRFEMNVLEIIRGDKKISIDLRHTPIESNDILLVRGAMEAILSFKEQNGLLLLTDVKLRDQDLSDENTVLVEVQVTPTSRLLSETLKSIDFRKSFGCFVLALNRTGELIRDKVASIPIKPWDTLLVFGQRSRVEALYKLEDFVPLGELDLQIHLAPRWWISALAIPIAVLLAALGVMSILKASILAVVVLLLSRRLGVQQAYRAVDWSVIFLLAAILPLGTAMEKTGLDASIGRWIGMAGHHGGPMMVLAATYLATAILTSVISNGATAVLMVPIALTAAAQLGVDPKPLLMAVTFAASASFLTPMGYQTNAMVYGPGNYRFSDYLRFGAPLNLLFLIASTLLIPVFWPF